MKKEAFVKELPIIIFVFLIVSALSAVILISNHLADEIVVESPTIIDHIEDDEEIYPVMNENNYIAYPYVDSLVTIGKNYYDFESSEDEQEKAIIKQDDTYYQNTGVDFVKENVFDVVSISEGTVTLVKDDDLVGKTVEIEHKNGLVSIYQSLSEVSVKKGDMVYQGQTIGKSGTNEIDKEIGNHLHFEIYENGSSKNPNLYLNKEYKKEN